MLDPFFPGPSWKLPRGTHVAHHSLVHFETNCKLCFDVGPSVGFWCVTYGTVSTVERKPLLFRGGGWSPRRTVSKAVAELLTHEVW
jgi:hypothetical protein